MNEQQKDTYIAWLNDAHAMETGLITVLEKQVEETKDLPDMQARISTHLEETKRHAALIKECVERHNASVSGTKNFVSQASAAIGGLGISFMSDAMVKNVHNSYAAEHFEIATYTLLSAAASELGDTETVSVCKEILKDEHAMAAWLLEQIPTITRNHVRTLD